MSNKQRLVKAVDLLPHRKDHVAVNVASIDGESYGGTVQCPTEAHADAIRRYLEAGRWDPATGRVWLEGGDR